MIRRDHIEIKDDPAAAEERMTNYAPIKRLGLPADIAEGVLYLTSDRASFVTGSSLSIDGGTTAGH
jgi:3-oxoacyl-[acyl-carrier protein] reductase